MTERELERRAQRRLAVLRHVEEVSGSVAATCRHYGISRQCYYRWLRRYEAAGLEGLRTARIDRITHPWPGRQRWWRRSERGTGWLMM